MQLGVQPTSLKFFPSLVVFYFVFKRHVCCMILLIFVSFFSAFTIIASAYTIIVCMKVSTTMTITMTFFTLTHFFCQLKSQLTNLFHNFLIIFFFLNVIKELISIFCFPFSCVFNIPITCLYLPIRSFVFNCK